MKWIAEKGMYSFEIRETGFGDYDMYIKYLTDTEYHWFNSYDEAIEFIKNEYSDMDDLEFKIKV